MARVRAGVETPLPGIRIHDLDLGEARVASYQVALNPEPSLSSHAN